MATHQQLVNEMSIVNNMGTEERLRHAQDRRTEQLNKWKEFEGLKTDQNNVEMKIKQTKSVKFGSCITLLEAAARNAYDEVKELLEEKIDPNDANEDGLTTLHQACIDNFEEIVELLLDYGAEVNAVDSEYWTPLHAACTCGHTNIAEILVKRGADLLALNADQNMPYDICEDIATLQFVEGAMAKKGITQAQINESRQSREKFILKEVSEYFENGGDISVTDKVGANILHVAAANGYVDLMRFFLKNNPGVVNEQDKDGWTALHAAACWCQLEVIEILAIEYNANASLKNNQGESPADVSEDEEIRLLLEKLVRAQNEVKRSKIRRSRITGGGSTRSSTVRGQSFKGRSKRDKKKGISSFEANSEAEFWQKGQKTDLVNDDSEESGGDSSSRTNTPTSNNLVSLSNNDQTNSENRKDEKSKNSRSKSSGKEKSKKLDSLKNNLVKGRSSSSKTNKVSKKDSKSHTTSNVQERVNGDLADHRSDLIGSSKPRKRGCIIL